MADYASAKHEKGLPKGNPFLHYKGNAKTVTVRVGNVTSPGIGN